MKVKQELTSFEALDLLCKSTNPKEIIKLKRIIKQDLKLAEKYKEPKISIAIYDQEEIHDNCTVQILTNSVTGEVSIGWWKNE